MADPVESLDHVDKASEDQLRRDVYSDVYDFETAHDVERFVEVCHEVHAIEDYITYNQMLQRHSLALKKKGRHKELSQVCKLDVGRRFADNPYPTLTCSQCELVTFNLPEAFDALNQWIQKDPKLEKCSPRTRLILVRTYCEILNADGAYDVAIKILEPFLASRSVEHIEFNAWCQSFGVLGRSYLGKGDYSNALDLFEATLVDQTLTANVYGITIARMNLGIAHLASENYKDAQDMFEDAMEAFRDLDDRAYAWSQLNLAIALAKTEEYEKTQNLVSSALDYYSTHLACSRDYLSTLENLSKATGFDSRVESTIRREHARVSGTIDKNQLSDEQLSSASESMSVFDLRNRASGRAPLRARTVTGGGFSPRSTIVKSFMESLDIDRAIEFLQTIKSNKPNHFAIPFYNDLLVKVCKKRGDLIDEYIIQPIDTILTKSDSIKLFYAKFLEAESQYPECEKLLDGIQNQGSYEYLNLRANLYSQYGQRYFDKAMDEYLKALAATRVEQLQARIYNNMAHLINKYRRRRDYETAIDHCQQAIALRSTVKWFYPSALMLALKIESANIGEIRGLVEEHRESYGLRRNEIAETYRQIHDQPKRRKFQEYAAE